MIASLFVVGSAVLAQTALAQLGLTDAAARKFLLDEFTAPTTHGRRSDIAGVQGIRAIAAGGLHMLALTATGTVMSWGADEHGQLGRGDGNTNRPGLIPSLTGVVSIAAGVSTSVAVLASGRIMTWGDVRAWTRPKWDASALVSRSPILLWLDGLEQG